MSNPLPSVTTIGDCCSTCEDPVTGQVPGPAGAAGTNGTNGTDGENAFTLTAAGFTVPAVNATVNVAVSASAWATVGQNVFVGGGAGNYEVTAKPDATHLTIENLGYAGNASPTTIIASGVQVSPSGQKGVDGAAGSSTLNDLSPTTTKGDILIDNGANSPNANVVRLGVGTDGQQFTAVAAQPTGGQWKTLLPNATSDNGIPRFDGTAGTPVPVQTSLMLISDTGAIQSTPSGGNARGASAIDLQVVRAIATQVASGSESVIGGGADNTASGANSTVAGGDSNEATGQHTTVSGGVSNQSTGLQTTVGGGSLNQATGLQTTVGGGASNVASSSLSTIGGGQANAASGLASFVGGGADNVASGDHSSVVGGQSNTASEFFSSVIGGTGAVASHYGEIAHASGAITNDGDAQRMVVVFRGVTTDATPTEIFLDGSAAFLDLPNDTTWAFRALVVARRTDVDGESAAYQLLGCIDRNANAASTALVGSVGKTVIAEDTAAWDTNAVANTADGALSIFVTGELAKSISWVCSVEISAVTG